MALAVSGAELNGLAVGVRCEDGLIAAIGTGVEPEAGDDLIDGAGTALVPGLVNAHTHAAMTLFRGYADDLPLMEWLQEHVWPAEAGLDAEDVYWGTRLACVEMIRTGTVRFWDMYWQPEATARAVIDAGLRATIGAPLIDVGVPDGAARLRDLAGDSVEALPGFGDRIGVALAPHAIYTVSPDSLRWVGELSAEQELPIHIHLSETEAEVAECLRQHGARPAFHLDALGVLGPLTLLAHSVWLDDAERALIAERGASLVTNPVANLKLAVGAIFDYPAAREAGIDVALGTDGAGSNNSLDMLSDVKHFALLQKHRAADVAAITAQEALEIATGLRAPLLGAAETLAVGAPADFLLVDLGTPGLALGSLAAGLVYSGSGGVVDTTVVAGRALMRGGVIEGAGDVLAHARERAARLLDA